MNLLYITWDFNPDLFHLGGLTIRWYGFLFALGFFFGYIILWKIFKKEGIPAALLDELTTYMVVATVVGARLGHCLFYEPEYYLSHPLDIFKVWEGGLASHGAAIGIVTAILIFSKIRKRPFLWVMDRIVIVVALAGVLIRLGNLMNSEIFGVPTTLSWGFYFLRASNPADSLVPRHPTQIYEALSYLIIFFILLWYYYKKDGKTPNGFLFGLFMILVFGMRFLIEFVKEPQVLFEKTMTLDLGQWLSIPLILAGIGFVVYASKTRKITQPGI